MVYWMQLTHDEVIDTSDLKQNSSKRIDYSPHSEIYEVSDLNKILEYILPDNVNVNITIDKSRSKSSLNNSQTVIYAQKSFFYRL